MGLLMFYWFKLGKITMFHMLIVTDCLLSVKLQIEKVVVNFKPLSSARGCHVGTRWSSQSLDRLKFRFDL